MDKSSKKLFSGAFVLGVSAFVAKILGAVYRIPLTKIIGGTGLGIYQMVFPVYTLLLDFSGAGVPNAVAKIISSYNGLNREVYARRVLKTGLIFFSALGVIFSLFTALFSNIIATAQGNVNANLAYVYLSPSVFLVCAISCFRGYFQGFMNMTPTAVSQIVEQGIKLLAGLYLAGLFMPDLPKAVAGATLAITLSEFIALIGLFIVYLITVKKQNLSYVKLNKQEFCVSLKLILRFVIPIAFTGMILPLSKVIDSFIIINFLSKHNQNATNIYGLFSGVATTVIGLPVAVCYGISAVSVPMISGAKTDKKQNNSLKAVVLTLAVSLPCAIFCFIFAPFIINFLFGYINAQDKNLSINLLRVCSPCVVLLSLLQTLNGVLVGKGNPKKPIIGLATGVFVKTLIELFTLNIPEIGIYGTAVGSIACYFVANLINLSMVFPIKFTGKKRESLSVKSRRYAGFQ